MAPVHHDVSRSELAVLQVLWNKGTATRREIADVLYPGGGNAHYATVQKLLERLETKGYVTSQRQKRILIFSPNVDREQLIQRRLLDVAEQLCGNSLTPLLMNLAHSKPLSDQEIDELRDLLEELRRESRPQKRKR